VRETYVNPVVLAEGTVEPGRKREPDHTREHDHTLRSETTVNLDTEASLSERLRDEVMQQRCDGPTITSAVPDPIMQGAFRKADSHRAKTPIREHDRHKVNKLQRRPKEPLQFKPYQTGDYFMMKRPKVYRQSNQKHVSKPIYKLRKRWTGPFRIVKVIGPNLYDADIHGVVKRVHAVNMKPGVPKRNKEQGLRDKWGSKAKLRI